MNKGVKAISQGLLDGGLEFSYCFPGFKSHEIFKETGGKKISLNEKIAYEEAYGSCIAGKRSAVMMKNVGLNVALDSFLGSIITGVHSGLVLVITDDVHIRGSQSKQDSRHFLDIFGGLWFEPNSLKSAYSIAYDSFELSEKFDIPIVIRLTNQFFELNGSYARKHVKHKQKELVHNPQKYIVNPMHWDDHYKELQKKQLAIQEFVDYKYRDVKIIQNHQIISFGVNTNEIKQLKNRPDALHIETYPIPNQLISEILNNNYNCQILEQGDPYAYNHIQLNLAKRINNKIKSNTGIKPDLGHLYKKWNKYNKLFKAIKKVNPEYCISDLTQFTLESQNVISSCLSLGSAIPVCIGLANTGVKKLICCVGDTSFLHTSRDALLEAISRNLSFTIILIDNGGSWCTGGQNTTFSIYKNLYHEIDHITIEYLNISSKDIANVIIKANNTTGIKLISIKVPNYESR